MRTLLITPWKMHKSIIFCVLIIFAMGQSKTSSAINFSLDTARVYFSPSHATLTPYTNLELMIDANAGNIGFVRIELTFDPTILKLEELTTTNLLNMVVEKTSMDEANNTGRIKLILGLSTVDRNAPPTGSIEIAQLRFKAITTQVNRTSYLEVDDTKVQIVNLNAIEVPFTSETAILTSNSTSNKIYLPSIFH